MPQSTHSDSPSVKSHRKSTTGSKLSHHNEETDASRRDADSSSRRRRRQRHHSRSTDRTTAVKRTRDARSREDDRRSAARSTSSAHALRGERSSRSTSRRHARSGDRHRRRRSTSSENDGHRASSRSKRQDSARRTGRDSSLVRYEEVAHDGKNWWEVQPQTRRPRQAGPRGPVRVWDATGSSRINPLHPMSMEGVPPGELRGNPLMMNASGNVRYSSTATSGPSQQPGVPGLYPAIGPCGGPPFPHENGPAHLGAAWPGVPTSGTTAGSPFGLMHPFRNAPRGMWPTSGMSLPPPFVGSAWRPGMRYGPPLHEAPPPPPPEDADASSSGVLPGPGQPPRVSADSSTVSPTDDTQQRRNSDASTATVSGPRSAAESASSTLPTPAGLESNSVFGRPGVPDPRYIGYSTRPPQPNFVNWNVPPNRFSEGPSPSTTDFMGLQHLPHPHHQRVLSGNAHAPPMFASLAGARMDTAGRPPLPWTPLPPPGMRAAAATLQRPVRMYYSGGVTGAMPLPGPNALNPPRRWLGGPMQGLPGTPASAVHNSGRIGAGSMGDIPINGPVRPGFMMAPEDLEHHVSPNAWGVPPGASSASFFPRRERSLEDNAVTELHAFLQLEALRETRSQPILTVGCHIVDPDLLSLSAYAALKSVLPEGVPEPRRIASTSVATQHCAHTSALSLIQPCPGDILASALRSTGTSTAVYPSDSVIGDDVLDVEPWPSHGYPLLQGTERPRTITDMPIDILGRCIENSRSAQQRGLRSSAMMIPNGNLLKERSLGRLRHFIAAHRVHLCLNSSIRPLAPEAGLLPPEVLRRLPMEAYSAHPVGHETTANYPCLSDLFRRLTKNTAVDESHSVTSPQDLTYPAEKSNRQCVLTELLVPAPAYVFPSFVLQLSPRFSCILDSFGDHTDITRFTAVGSRSPAARCVSNSAVEAELIALIIKLCC